MTKNWDRAIFKVSRDFPSNEGFSLIVGLYKIIVMRGTEVRTTFSYVEWEYER